MTIRHCRAAFAALALLIAASTSAFAQKADYQVVIEAPAPLRKLVEENLALVKWRGNERIDREQLKRLFEESKAEIATLVATEGYYLAAIDARLDESGERWVARFTIEPNEPARVKSVDFQFRGGLAKAPAEETPGMAELKSGWLLPEGAVFRQGDWEAAKRKILQQLVVYRYPQAKLAASRAEVDVRSNEVKLHLDVDSGPPVLFAPLSVAGLRRYPEAVVVNLNPIQSGQPYSQAALIEFQRRLQETGYFLRADVSAENVAIAADGAAVAPVVVSVEENPRQRVGLGAGYSTNTGYRGQVSYDRLGLFGSALRLKSALVLEAKKQSGQVEFLFPVNERGARDSLSTLVKREDVQNETTRTTGLSATRAWGQPELERSITFTYGRERKDVLNDLGIETAFSQTLSANYSVTWRRTDNLLAPSRGYLLNLQAGAAPSRFLTTTPFARLYGKYAGYFPLGANNTAILRAEAGVVGAKDRTGIPADFLFRAGGDQSLRGYGYQELGVREGAAVVGGRYLALAGAEVVHWLAPTHPAWGIAAFVDAGNAGDRPADLEPVYGYGLGARWKSPVGVVNLDIAYGQQVKQARLHFSLGVTF